MNEKLVISLKEARKILGKEISDKMSDQEVEQLIQDLDELARLTLRAIRDGTLKLPINIRARVD